jgi:hypothetical protein
MSPLAADARRRFSNEAIVFAVQRHEKACVRSRSERGHEVVLVERWKLRYATVAQERLDADGAPLAQRAQARWISVDEPAPESEIDDR